MLIANNHTIEEIREIIGVDSLGYLSIEDAKRLATGEVCDRFCVGCFSGDYPTDVPTHAKKNRFEGKISESEGR